MTSFSIIFCGLLLVLSSQQTISKAEKTSDVINQACDKTLFKDLCISALGSFPGSKNADLHGLAGIALKIAAANSTAIYDRITELLKKTSDDFTQQGLTDCSENYQDAIDQIENSLAALESNGYNDINTWVSAAMSDAESCEDGFNEQEEKSSPLTEMNTKFNKLCSITLAIVNQLAKN